MYGDFEVGIGMICACLPSMNAALSQLFPNVFGRKDSSPQSDYNTGSRSAASYLVGSTARSNNGMSLDQPSSKGLMIGTET